MKRLIAALLFALVGTALSQNGPTGPTSQAGRFQATQYGQWQLHALNGVAPGSRNIAIDNCYPNLGTNVTQFYPLATNAPLQIVDGANSETVTPTQVSTPRGTQFGDISVSQYFCQFTATFTKTHYTSVTITSATLGLQEAINDAHNKGGGIAVIDATWQGQTSMLTVTAVGFSNVMVEDNRNGEQFYTWNGSHYVVSSVAGGMLNPAANGLVACTGSNCSTTATRTLIGSADLSITNGDGVAGNPTFAFTTTGVNSGSYVKPTITIDNKGRITAAVASIDNVPFIDPTNAQAWTGGDPGAWFNAMVTSLGSTGGPVAILCGNYPPATTQFDTTGGKNIDVRGCFTAATIINWTVAGTCAFKVGGATGGVQHFSGFTIKGNNSGSAGQCGIYINNANNPLDIDHVEITQMGDEPLLTDGATSNVTISRNTFHLNLFNYAAIVNSSSAENVAFYNNSFFNNLGGVSLAQSLGGVGYYENDTESGSTGAASLPMLNIPSGSTGNVLMHNTFGYGASTTGTQVALINANAGVVSIGDSFSIGKAGQTALTLGSSAQANLFLRPSLSGIGTGVGTGLLVTAGALDNLFIFPQPFNNLGTNATTNNPGTRTSIISNIANLAVIDFLGNITAEGQLISGVNTGTAPLVVASTTAVNNLTVANHALVKGCGGVAACSPTSFTNSKIWVGSVALSSGTPSTATITGISPAYSGTNNYYCTVTNNTTAADSLKVTNVSASSFTITGPNTVTDTVTWMCVGI